MVLQRSESNFQVTGIVALNNVFQRLSGIVEEKERQPPKAIPGGTETEMSSLRTRLLDSKQ